VAIGSDGNALIASTTSVTGYDFISVGDLFATNDLSDLSSTSTAISNLGLTIGADTQAFDANLDTFAALSATGGNIIVATSSDWVALGVGTDGYLLMASSTAINGIAWENVTITGDVTDVGDCTGGLCLDGTSDGGTFIRLYDGDSNYTEFLSANVAATTFVTFPGLASSTLIAAESDLSDLSSTSTAISNLGLTIGADTQAFDANLDTFAALSATGGNIIVATSSDWVALGVGTDGYLLMASSTAINGIAWENVVAGSSASTTLDVIEDVGANFTTEFKAFDWTIDSDGASSTLVIDGGAGTVTIAALSLSGSGTVLADLGLTIGADTQAWDANLDTFAGLSTTAGNIIVATSSDWVAQGVGSDGALLMASSTATNGLVWQSPIVRTVTLSPEFAGAVLTGDGANNVGTMTSDFCSDTLAINATAASTTAASPCDTALSEEHNYYTWTADASNDYDIWVRWQVPSDFSAFNGASAITYYGWRSSTSDDVIMTLYDNADAICNASSGLAEEAAWAQVTYSDPTGCSNISAGDIVTFRLTLDVRVNGEHAKVGEIDIDYTTVF